MKQYYTLLALTLGGALMLGGLAPTMAMADSATDIAELKRMIMEMQKAHDAEIAALKKQINNLQKPAQMVDSQGVDVTKLKQQVAELHDIQTCNEESLMSRIQIHGSFSQGYLLSDENDWLGKTKDGTFNFNEFTVNISTDLTDKLRAGIQIMSRDMGEFVNNDVKVDWAMADYAWRDELGLRFGLLKVPMGFYSESRDIDGARISLLLPQGFYGENTREIFNTLKGLGAYGNIDMGSAGSLNYLGLFGGQDFDEDGETAGKAADFEMIDANSANSVTTDDTLALSLTWDTPLEGMRVNTTYYESNVTMDAEKTTPLGTLPAELVVNKVYNWSSGVEYTWNDLIVAGEFRRIRRPTELYLDGTLGAATTKTSEGWYLSSSYRFTDWFATELSYSEYYPDKDDRHGENLETTTGKDKIYGYSKTWSINTRFDLNDYWILKAAANMNEGAANTYGWQNLDGIEKDWILYQFKTTVFF